MPSDKKTTLLPVTAESSTKDVKAPRTPPSAELNWVYTIYVTYEAILINLVGFFTLIFQCELQDLAATIEERFPWIPKLLIDSATGHYWLQGDLNCSTPSARCLTYMVAGWLFIAGVLQVVLNFDGLRQRLFPSDMGLTPRGAKIVCMYSFFACDWYWVVLMYCFRTTIGWQQIVGSAFDIMLRLPFAFRPANMFKT